MPSFSEKSMHTDFVSALCLKAAERRNDLLNLSAKQIGRFCSMSY